MFIAYVDESGDSGYDQESSTFYVLGALVIHEDQWNDFHENAIAFLKGVKQKYCRKSSKPTEIHLKEFQNGQRGWQKTNLVNYHNDFADFLNKNSVVVFGIAICKRNIKHSDANPLPQTAIGFLLERLSGYIKNLEKEREKILVTVDNSSQELHAKWRNAVRFFKERGSNYLPAGQFSEYIIEEAVFVDSKTSPEIQLADSIAGFIKLYISGKREYQDLPQKFPFYCWKNKLGWGLKIWPEEGQ